MSDRLDTLINNSAQDHMGEGSTMFLSSAILNHDQKDACEHNGNVSDEDKGLIESIIDTLHMKHT